MSSRDSQIGSGSRSTMEIYAGLVRAEVKSLSCRMAQIAEEVASLSENLRSILLEVEDQSINADKLKTGLEFCKSEISEVKKLLLVLQEKVDGMVDSG